MVATKDVRKTIVLKKKKERLVQEYKVVQGWIFNYKEYTLQCTGTVLKPRELIQRRDELFQEIGKLTRQIRKQGG